MQSPHHRGKGRNSPSFFSSSLSRSLFSRKILPSGGAPLPGNHLRGAGKDDNRSGAVRDPIHPTLDGWREEGCCPCSRLRAWLRRRGSFSIHADRSGGADPVKIIRRNCRRHPTGSWNRERAARLIPALPFFLCLLLIFLANTFPLFFFDFPVHIAASPAGLAL